MKFLEKKEIHQPEAGRPEDQMLSRKVFHQNFS